MEGIRAIQILLIFINIVIIFGQRWHFPPPRILLGKSSECVTVCWEIIGNGIENDARISCNGGTFNLSMGYYIPCRAHKSAREPPQWCLSIRHYNWTQYGCHCDSKIGSCIVERYQELGKNLEWSFCIYNEEFYCPTEAPRFTTPSRIPIRVKTTPITTIPPDETTIQNLVDEFRQ